MFEFKEEDDALSVVGLDGFNGDDYCYMGCIYKHEDGYYWFEPSADRAPLSCKGLQIIAKKLSDLNKGEA